MPGHLDRHVLGARHLGGALMTVLVAPDSFKGTFRSPEVAAAIGRGLERARASPPTWRPPPTAATGPSTCCCSRSAVRRARATVQDPLGRPIDARFGLLADGEGAVVEMAQRQRPVARGRGRARRRGGDDLRHRRAHRRRGGGGREGRARLRRAAARPPTAAPGALQAIADGGGLRGAKLVVLSDVRTPFEHAAAVFGPQKGADPAAVKRLTERLHRLAGRFARDPRTRPMTGAARRPRRRPVGCSSAPSSCPARRSSSTRSRSTSACARPARWSPARAASTSRPSRARWWARWPRARASAACPARPSSGAASSTASAAACSTSTASTEATTLQEIEDGGPGARRPAAAAGAVSAPFTPAHRGAVARRLCCCTASWRRGARGSSRSPRSSGATTRSP